MARSRQVVGSSKRADAEAAPVQQTWNTDKLEGEDPEFQYQFMRESEVRDRSRSKTVLNRRTGETVRVAGWTVCKEGEDEVRMLGDRPDLAAPTDTTMTMGPHVLMKIPKASHEMLLHEKDAVTDAMENRLMRGGIQEEHDGIPVANVAFAPHPALMGQQGAEDYSQKEGRIANKLDQLAGR